MRKSHTDQQPYLPLEHYREVPRVEIPVVQHHLSQFPGETLHAGRSLSNLGFSAARRPHDVQRRNEML